MSKTSVSDKSITIKKKNAVLVRDDDCLFDTTQINSINRRTPEIYKYKHKARGGGFWDYGKVSFFRKQLNRIFGYNWDFEVKTSLSEAFDIAQKTKVCVVIGRLTCRVRNREKKIEETIIKEQVGRCEVKFKKDKKTGLPTNNPLDFGNDMKGAVSDCLKKCAAFGLGIASDIYDKEDYIELEIEDTEEKKDTEVKKLVKKTDKMLEEIKK